MRDQEKRYQEAMNQGHSAAWDQKWDQAARFYRQALKEKPGDIKALNSLALACYELRDYERALPLYLKVAEKNPQDPVPLERIATLYEMMGKPKVGAEAAVRAAELYLKNQDVEKAIENWTRAVGMDPEHVLAHSRLAVVYERLKRRPQAVREYLYVASLMQHAGERDKAVQAIDRAMQLDPGNPEIRQSLAMLRDGVPLPKPARPAGGTGPIQQTGPKLLETPSEEEESTIDPIEAAKEAALSVLADLFFEQSSDFDERHSTRADLKSIVDGTGPLFPRNVDKTRLMHHLGQAIDYLTQGEEKLALEELKQTLEQGLNHPAAYFIIGWLLARSDHVESAIRNLKRAVSHLDFALGARLLLGELYRKKGKVVEAAVEYLEALGLAESLVVSQEEADIIRPLYEPLIESFSRDVEEDQCAHLSDTISEMLLRPDWRQNLRTVRQQVLPGGNGRVPTPLAEVLTEAKSSQVVVAMGEVRQLASKGRYHAAMEEAFYAIEEAPTYLPLHIVIGELLLSVNQVQAGIEKFMVVARTYSVRGETGRAIDMLRKVVDLSPIDLEARRQLIDQLIARGQNDEALKEYLKMGEVHYSLAELGEARKTYSRALRLAQQVGVDDSWSVRILHRIADIDVQSLNWRQALMIYEQIFSLKPNDIEACRNLVDLNLRLGERTKAMKVLDVVVETLQHNADADAVISLLEKLVQDWPKQARIHIYLAEQYQLQGKTAEAIEQLDEAGEILLEAGDRRGAAEIVEKIIALNPPTVDKYRQLLAEIRGK